MATATAEQTRTAAGGRPSRTRAAAAGCGGRRSTSCCWYSAFWLIPTIGLFVTSLMQPTDFQQRAGGTTWRIPAS